MPRVLAIGDIHGCSAALDALIRAVPFRASDHLVTLGDYVNRGPDTAGVIDRLIALSEVCTLTPILGNHDQAFLDVVDRRIDPSYMLAMGGTATLESYGLGRSRLRASAFPACHLDFLRSCRSYVETATHIFIHASYDPLLPMSEQPIHSLRWESLRDFTPEPHCSGKRVVTGHTSQKSGEVLDLGHIVCIDTFCYGGGWLTALDVGTGQIWQASRDGRLRSPSPPG